MATNVFSDNVFGSKDEDTLADLRRYNQLWKAQDDMWAQAARRTDISPTAFWILYVLYIEEENVTQADLCERWFFSRQTVNSAVKKLQTEGIVVLENAKERGNVKVLKLTEAGREFVNARVKPLADADFEAFASFSPEERKLLLALMQRQLDVLQLQLQLQTDAE